MAEGVRVLGVYRRTERLWLVVPYWDEGEDYEEAQGTASLVIAPTEEAAKDAISADWTEAIELPERSTRLSMPDSPQIPETVLEAGRKAAREAQHQVTDVLTRVIADAAVKAAIQAHGAEQGRPPCKRCATDDPATCPHPPQTWKERAEENAQAAMERRKEGVDFRDKLRETEAKLVEAEKERKSWRDVAKQRLIIPECNHAPEDVEKLAKAYAEWSSDTPWDERNSYNQEHWRKVARVVLSIQADRFIGVTLPSEPKCKECVSRALVNEGPCKQHGGC